MYMDFKPNKIVRISKCKNYLRFIAIVDSVDKEKNGTKGHTTLSSNNVVLDCSVRTEETFFIKCYVNKHTGVPSMDFKNYEIYPSDKNSAYVDSSTFKAPTIVNHEYVISNIIKGYYCRIKGNITKTEKNESIKGIPIGATIISIDVFAIDFFKKDKSLEGLSDFELLNKFNEYQDKFLSEEELKQFKGK